MDFSTAVRTCLSKYVDFKGRARRAEYWYFYLFYVIAYIVAAVLDGLLTNWEGPAIITVIVVLGLFLPNLAVSVRRLHDTNKTGWWILIALIPIIGAIVLLVFFVTRGTEGPNDYGPDPLADDAVSQF